MVGEGRKQALLVLEDGSVYRGNAFAGKGEVLGEVVFNTGMTGYQEILTDPSYAEQLICFTAPMVGTYGVARGRSTWNRPESTWKDSSSGSTRDIRATGVPCRI
jgi:carbamoylphosphate synthase small subunit